MTEAIARRFSMLRWLGIGLFWVALGLLLVSLWAAFQGWLEPRRLLFCLLGLGLSLGAFGTASDTALHAMRELRIAGKLPSSFAAEWAIEVQKRADRIPNFQAHPRMAMGMPLLAASALGWSFWRLLQVWGGA